VTGVVADASPLIAFQQIGQLSLLQALFTTLLVPPAVAREIAPSVPPQPWIVERQPAQPLAPQVLQASLGPGESEAISLALELRADRFIVDEKAARHLAQALGLNVVGTLGVLLAAKRKGLIPAVRPLVEALLEKNFWISPQLVERALSEIREGSRP
jgi:predicted nucleic acid-binding protein